MPDEWPIAVGYEPWIEEVWLNYINNAVKYGGEPPVLELGSDSGPDGMVRFWVRDNGMGVALPDQKQLFRAHTRFGPKKVSGEGLGLSIVFNLVQELKGTPIESKIK